MLPPALRQLLKEHSRSFYLSLFILPSSLRFPISLAYLLARIADTIADHSILDCSTRIEALSHFESALSKNIPTSSIFENISFSSLSSKEKHLLQHTSSALNLLFILPPKTQFLVQKIVQTLILGMQQNLKDFPKNSRAELVALRDEKHLQEYCYYAAGCVGEFWTQISFEAIPRLRGRSLVQMTSWGKAYGEGLQLINILQDIPRDLETGRCYLPSTLFRLEGVSLQEFREKTLQANVLQPLLQKLIAQAEINLRQGIRYIEAIPLGEIRLRLACAWPLLIGLETLLSLKKHPDLLNATPKVKVPRKKIYKILLKTLFFFPFQRGSRFCFQKYLKT